MRKLYFALGNAKLGKHVATFSLPAGHSCPAAVACSSRANRETGKLTDGARCKFRCYAASAENLFKSIRVSRWRNFEALKGLNKYGMANLIHASIPKKATHCRIHASGDFFSQTYFDAWNEVAAANPTIIFYAYTKALHFWCRGLGSIAPNLHLVASFGGLYDKLIISCKFRSVRVVFTEAEAELLNLPIDHDDSHVWNYSGDFAILLHGTQPKGSKAGLAWQRIKTTGPGGYRSDYFNHYKKN